MQRLSPVNVTTDISKKAYTDGELYFIGDPVLTTTGDRHRYYSQASLIILKTIFKWT